MSAPLRILLTVKKRGWNGETANTLDIARGCRDAGHHVVVAARADSSTRARARRAGLETLDLDLEHSPMAWGALARDIRRLRRVLPSMDVVHTHASWDTWVVALARIALRGAPPLVRSRHNLKHIRRNVPNRWLYGRAITRIVAPSETIADDVRSNLLLASTPVSRILHGIDLERFDVRAIDRETARRELRELVDAAPDAPVVVYVSRVAPRKRPDLLLDVAERLRVELPTTRFLIFGEFAGSPTWIAKFKARIESMNPTVQEMGFTKDVPRLLAGADVFALPAPTEPFGLATVEAAAMGCPAIGPRAAGLAETIADGETGVLFEPDDTDDFANSLAALIRDPERHARMSAAGPQRARELFDAERMIREYIEMYSALAR